jgi:16S rRNA C967 or C1407 C5-methylase (RsmB/RsmF family)
LVIYSTCTLNPFENEIQIKNLLEKYGDILEILPIDVKNKSEGIVINDK